MLAWRSLLVGVTTIAEGAMHFISITLLALKLDTTIGCHGNLCIVQCCCLLNLLLDGRDRKQIADQMGISENTVSGYAKDVYRHFDVNSHVELMRKFLHAHKD